MKEIHSYIIRIYRRNAEAFAGLVEHVQTRRTIPFQSLAELCDVLGGRKRFPRRPVDQADTPAPGDQP